MHRPPAVTHRVARSRWHLRLVLAIALLGTATCALLQTHLSSPVARLACLAIPAAALCLAYWDWKQAAVGLLQWDGQQWLWTGFGDQPVHSVRLTLDFQRLMLIKVVAEGGSGAWLWLEAPSMDRHWLALRRALFASQTSGPAEKSAQVFDSTGVML
jgi:toxin CptA